MSRLDQGEDPLAGETLEFALKYAELGWPVLPVNGKKPTLKAWPVNASTVPSHIRHWFKNRRNIGIATGSGSGIVVIDVDPRNGGDLSLEQLEKELGPLPKTTTANTGGGGKHFLFQDFEGSKSKIFRDGVDFLAGGKMFVVSPSVHPCGEIYRWEYSPWDMPPQELPSAWRRELHRSTGSSSGDSLNQQRDSTPIAEGHRNTTLASLAGQLKADGLTLKEVKTRLLEDNQTRCTPPLELDEVIGIAKSVLSLQSGNKSFKTQWQEAVLDSQLPPRLKLTLLALSRHANQHGRSCFPTQETIAANASSTPKTASKLLNEAEKRNWVEKYKHARNGPGYNYGYILKLSSVAATEPKE